MKLSLIHTIVFLVFSALMVFPALALQTPFQGSAPGTTGEKPAAPSDDPFGSDEGEESDLFAQEGDDEKAAGEEGESGEEAEDAQEPEDTEDGKTAEEAEAKEKKPKEKRPKREPGKWISLNEKFEVKRINSADLNLRGELPSTKAENKWEMDQYDGPFEDEDEEEGKSESKKKHEPIPESLKDFEPLQIKSAIVSQTGKIFMTTTDGLVQYQFDGSAEFVRNEKSEIVKAACVARDPVDGILIGLEKENKVLEMRDSGKLISRGKLDSDVKDVKDKAKLSVTHVVAAGSDYLALSNEKVYRRFPEGNWENQGLQTDGKPISQFALLESREIATSDSSSTDLRLHPLNGIGRKVQASKESGHASNSRNVLVNSVSSMKIRKLIPDLEGGLFCVFAKERTPSKTPLKENPFNDDSSVTAGACTLSGSCYDDLVTSNDFDWGVDGLPEKDRTVIDFCPGPSGEPGDVWFLTPEGVGLFANQKTEFWKSPFKLDRKGHELSRIEGLGGGNYMVFTNDGKHGEDVFFIRPKK